MVEGRGPLIIGTCDPATREILVATLERLPPAVQSFVCDRCEFTPVGKCVAACAVSLERLAGNGTTWLIVVDERIPAERLPDIVAHEIAHAYLDHRGSVCEVGHLDEQNAADEDAARQLTAKWGFTIGRVDADGRTRV